MWHRFSVVLAAITISGLGYFALPAELAVNLAPANVDVADAVDAVAARGSGPRQGRGSGRRAGKGLA